MKAPVNSSGPRLSQNKLFEIKESLFGDKFKTEYCVKFKQLGACPYGERCNFAHGDEQIRTRFRHPNYQTKPCLKFIKGGVCPYGTRCTFLHSLEPVKKVVKHHNRPRNYKTKPCALFIQGEHCPFGDRCTFIHDLADKRNQVTTISAAELKKLPARHKAGCWNPDKIKSFDLPRPPFEESYVLFKQYVGSGAMPDHVLTLKDNKEYVEAKKKQKILGLQALLPPMKTRKRKRSRSLSFDWEGTWN